MDSPDRVEEMLSSFIPESPSKSPLHIRSMASPKPNASPARMDENSVPQSPQLGLSGNTSAKSDSVGINGVSSGKDSLKEIDMNQDVKVVGDGGAKVVEDRMKMPPPPFPSMPVNIHAPTPPPRMTRLPSLQQLSHHLHIPSPTPSQNSTTGSPSTEHPSPSRGLNISLSHVQGNASPGSQSLGSPNPMSPSFAGLASPSGRLKLPASAMTRSRSSGGSISGPTGGFGAPPLSMAMSRKTSEQPGGLPSPLQVAGTPPGLASVGDANGTGSPDPFLVGLSPRTPLTRTPSMQRKQSRDYVQGYKDVPSLAEIRDRVRGMSISGGSGGGGLPSMESPLQVEYTPPTANGASKNILESAADRLGAVDEKIDNLSPPSTASSVISEEDMKNKEFPLSHAWTLFFDSKTYKPDPTSVSPVDGKAFLTEYEKSLLTVGKFDTIQGFARYMNNLRMPSGLTRSANYHLFKRGIRPMWEDPANANGGKWIVLFRNCQHLFDNAWANLTMSLIGDVLDPEDQVCGIVASNRPKIDRIQLWTRGREDIDSLNELGKAIWDTLGLDGRDLEGVSMEFQYNSSSAHPPANKFINIPFPTRGGTGSAYGNPPATPSRLSSVTSPTFPPPQNGLQQLQQNTSSSSTLQPPKTPGMHGLPATPDKATIQASLSPVPSNPFGGGMGMKRMGSGQGVGAFSGPMGIGGARSPRSVSPALPATPSFAQ